MTTWINKQIELLKKGNDIIVNGEVVLDFRTFAIELECAFADADSEDDQYTATLGRMTGHLSETQIKKDQETIYSVACELLSKYELDGIAEHQRIEKEDAAITNWECDQAAGF